MVRPFLILAVRRDCRVVHPSCAKDMSVRGVPIFHLEDVWHHWVVKQVLANGC